MESDLLFPMTVWGKHGLSAEAMGGPRGQGKKGATLFSAVGEPSRAGWCLPQACTMRFYLYETLERKI